MKIAPGTPLNVSLGWDIDDFQPVGKLAYRDRIAYFEFDDAFLRAGLELSPVHHETSVELQRPYKEDVFEGLHGYFHDSLPDGWGRLLVDRRARQLGVEPTTLTPLDRLACVGSNGIGALCYTPSIEIWESGDNELDLGKLAADARLVLEGDISEVLPTLGQAGGSPGGARPKALIALSDHGHAVHGIDEAPEGYDHYLVKFPGQGDPQDIAAIEMAYAMMAKEAGIIMPETKLLEGGDGGLYFAARRFDRDGTRRVHVHTASGLLYSDIRIPALDYKDLILLTRNLTRDQRECNAMFALAVFNVLSHNRDDHARQFSFIMARDGLWRMAPAYDLTWSSGPGGEHSTSVLGHGKNITRTHLIELSKTTDMKERDAMRVIERVETTVGEWINFANEYGVSAKSSQIIAVALAKVRLLA
ncbi:MAG: type II toxin-antitoxin system HipA family toxin [Alphaproteobacteria bacterium]|nr:type II toxin-antitoxin system HipA family toxin [Alphaproteobacteria bacterium]